MANLQQIWKLKSQPCVCRCQNIISEDCFYAASFSCLFYDAEEGLRAQQEKCLV